jgi:hypothetical protein
MAWEERNGRMYYYRKRREGGRVVSEYVGAGIGAEAIATMDRIDQEEQKIARLQMQDERMQYMKDEREAMEFGELTRLLTRAALLLAGYHPYKGQWRTRKDDR